MPKKKSKVKEASVFPGASLWSIVTSIVAPAIRERTVHSLRGFGYDQNWLSVIGSFIGGEGDFTDSQVKDMVERVYPTGLKKGWINEVKK